MAKLNNFEEIEVWKKSMQLCVEVYSITQDSLFSKDFPLRDQIRKSATSIPSNIAEGFERESNNSFIYFLLIAKGSAGELRTQLALAKNLNYINETKYTQLYHDCLDVSKQLSGFISYLRQLKSEKQFSKSSKLS